jgi:hypothetical protein
LEAFEDIAAAVAACLDMVACEGGVAAAVVAAVALVVVVAVG